MSLKIVDAEITDGERVEQFMLTVPEFALGVVAGEERNLWNWLYVRGENQVRSAVIAVTPEGRVVGHYGMSPLGYRVQGQGTTAGIICRLAVDADYRKTPTFMQMSLRLLKQYPSRGYSFAAGLANRSGLLEFHLAFGFKEIGEIPVLAKPISICGLAKGLWPATVYTVVSPILWLCDVIYQGGLKLLSALKTGMVSIKQVQDLSHVGDELNHIMEKQFLFTANRDPAWLKWRFQDAPHRNYLMFEIREGEKLAGYFVLRKMQMKKFMSLAVVDFVTDFSRPDFIRQAISKMKQVAIEEHCDLIAILASSDRVVGALKSAGFLKSPESFSLVIHTPKRTDPLLQSRLNDWYVTWLDHDFV
jgi:GNAT acetyltransferase-like protein